VSSKIEGKVSLCKKQIFLSLFLSYNCEYAGKDVGVEDVKDASLLFATRPRKGAGPEGGYWGNIRKGDRDLETQFLLHDTSELRII